MQRRGGREGELSGGTSKRLSAKTVGPLAPAPPPALRRRRRPGGGDPAARDGGDAARAHFFSYTSGLSTPMKGSERKRPAKSMP